MGEPVKVTQEMLDGWKGDDGVIRIPPGEYVFVDQGLVVGPPGIQGTAEPPA